MTLQIRDHSNKVTFNVEATTKREAVSKAVGRLGVTTNLTVHKPCGNGSYRKI